MTCNRIIQIMEEMIILKWNNWMEINRNTFRQDP